MKFSELDTKMRVYETAHDHCVLPGMHIVVRLDGRSFTKLTKETLPEKAKELSSPFEVPFDQVFNHEMVSTVQHLMEDAGVRVVYGFTQSDEISLLLHPSDDLFGRKERKLNSVLAGEASASLSRRLREQAVFDSRVCQFPTDQLVVDYFRWRQEDAARNALSSHCFYAMLRKEKISPADVHEALKGVGTAAKNQLLFGYGINFNDLPSWQKRGVGLFWQTKPITGHNPQTGEATTSVRKRLVTARDLPMKDEYSDFIRKLLAKTSADQHEDSIDLD